MDDPVSPKAALGTRHGVSRGIHDLVAPASKRKGLSLALGSRAKTDENGQGPR